MLLPRQAEGRRNAPQCTPLRCSMVLQYKLALFIHRRRPAAGGLKTALYSVTLHTQLVTLHTQLVTLHTQLVTLHTQLVTLHICWPQACRPPPLLMNGWGHAGPQHPRAPDTAGPPPRLAEAGA